MTKLTKEDILKRFYITHNNKYSYDLSNFKTVLDKINIKCPIHGFFNQSIRKHYKGQGCPKCKGKNKTTKDVINIFKKIHKDKYIYDKTVFVNNKTPLIIKCKKHGYFSQSYDHHSKGGGCPNCAGNILMTTKQFIDNSKRIYGNRYDYSKTEYISSKKKVIIICPKHGEFKQLPINHYRCEGCKKCLINKKSSNNDDFIEKAIKVHGNKYDYSLVEYTHNSKKVIIICRKHGKFTQTPNGHTNGNGCLKCGKIKSQQYSANNPTGWTKTKWKEAGLKSKYFDSFKVYIIKCWNDNEEFYKIGRTFTTVKHRFANKKCNMPYNYKLIKEFVFTESNDAYNYENELKRLYKEFKYNPNIYFKGCRECFKIPPTLLSSASCSF